MTNIEKIRTANVLIKEVLTYESQRAIKNTALKKLSPEVVSQIVNYWYTQGLCPDIFSNEEGVEIDEYIEIQGILSDL